MRRQSLPPILYLSFFYGAATTFAFSLLYLSFFHGAAANFAFYSVFILLLWCSNNLCLLFCIYPSSMPYPHLVCRPPAVGRAPGSRPGRGGEEAGQQIEPSPATGYSLGGGPATLSWSRLGDRKLDRQMGWSADRAHRI